MADSVDEIRLPGPSCAEDDHEKLLLIRRAEEVVSDQGEHLTLFT